MELTDKYLKLTPKRIESLHALGIYTAEELLSYYPFRYDVLSCEPFGQWKEKDKVTFEAEIVSAARTHRFGRNRSMTKFDVMMENQILHITIFNRPWAKQLQLNTVLTISGIYNGKQNVTATNYSLGSIADKPAVTPVYPVKAGITQRTIRECMKKVFTALQGRIYDQVPEVYRQAYRLEHREKALYSLHFPESMDEIRRSYRTLKYEEFLRFFLSMLVIKSSQDLMVEKIPRVFDRKKIDDLINGMPFEATPDQKNAIEAILKDMQSPQLMYRLVQGDVGCGKTFVAEVVLYAAVLSGYQGALLAPTEILARQHLESIAPMLEPLGIRCAVLYSGEKTVEKNRILKDVAEGTIDILIGTHSLLQNQVIFKNLGLVVADEQQRFGVEQRRALREKGTRVDFLLMSATPIPRTLASTLYGDMEISTIETMPKGRKPVKTTLLEENSFRSVLKDVKGLLREGRQLYVICAAVEDSEEYDARNVVDTAESLKKLFSPEYEVGLLHGRMSSEEKQDVMKQFEQNKIQILVSTTVVEVGVSVANATGMIVYDADRFGLSQLHQLRGRIQRGSNQGLCWLLTDAKDERTLERLQVLVDSSNGFEISFQDLRLRGPGDMLGTRQSGVPDLLLGNIVEDTNIINTARKDAATIFAQRDSAENRAIMRVVIARNEKNASYVD